MFNPDDTTFNVQNFLNSRYAWLDSAFDIAPDFIGLKVAICKRQSKRTRNILKLKLNRAFYSSTATV